MKEHTEAASMITHYDDKKTYDMYCKKLLSNKQILAYVIKGCIPEFADIPLKDIPSYIEMSSINNTAACTYIDDKQIEVTDESIPGSQIKYDIQFEAALPTKQEDTEKRSCTKERLRISSTWKVRQRIIPGIP